MTDIIVYVPDIPLDVDQNVLENLIQTRVESLRVKTEGVKCYLQLGVAVIKLRNEADKTYLVKEVQSIVLKKDEGINISVVDEIELDSYIVIDKKLQKMPMANEVAQRFAQAYSASTVHQCAVVSDQFPNVFRIFFKRFDELVQISNKPDFRISGGRATVYPRSDCNFFEDLPLYIDETNIRSALVQQIQEAQLVTRSFYIQHNKQTSTALIIAFKSVKRWEKEVYLTIDGQNIEKKAKLSYRVLVSPIPEGFNIEKILQHKLFANRVASHRLIGDKLIVEFRDLNRCKACVDIGGFAVDDQVMRVKQHTAFFHPESCEVDELTWYGTAMNDIKPDITTIMNNHQHPIFQFKWNAEIFRRQMEDAAKRGQVVNGYDLTRHLLRVTVMLNTIATLRKKKYLVDDKEIVLKLEKMQTIGYNNQSKLFTKTEVLESDLKLPYPSTTVKVIHEDCLVLYEQLVKQGRRPLILNMANATRPGGDYRKGDGAQEENIIRRSDYYHSLDGELADKNRSERLYCTPKGDLKPLVGFASFYPMEEFGAIYTSGITVFRGTEQDGYPYKKEPLYNMCAIAMAAYRDPPLTSENTLQNRAAMNTHRKIESIFAIGHHQKHDCLVLSALGCGAFHNPPEHVARLFKSVIYQYAGYFDTIHFAIIDDHKAKRPTNPYGNYESFNKILDGLIVRPPKRLRVDGMTGPYRVLDKRSDGRLKLSDVYISQTPPCQQGRNCRDAEKTDHRREFSHPPRCSFQKMNSVCDQLNDEVHMSCFTHVMKCGEGGECTNKDAAHLNGYDHPGFCKKQAHCIDMHPDHLLSYQHLPACPDGTICQKYLRNDNDHTEEFRHVKSICTDDNCCSKFYKEKHLERTIHSFREPCPFTPYTCAKFVKFCQTDANKKVALEVEKHCLQYSHVCPYGRQCTMTDDKHYQTHIHIARHMCPDGNKCLKLTDENHLESYSHPNMRDIRLLCPHPGYKCHQKSHDNHLKIYRHSENSNHMSVAPSSNYNSNVNFVQNQVSLIRTVNSFISKEQWKETEVLGEIREWIRALQPVHRCRQEIFESILIHGHVMSRKYMEKLIDPKCVAKAVMQHPQVRAVLLKYNRQAVRDDAFKLIKSLVKAEFSKTGADGIIALNPYEKENQTIAATKLKLLTHDHDFEIISDWTKKIAEASVRLLEKPTGIRFRVDPTMETDSHVFGILGPHLDQHYGDIVITFKQEIMYHFDSYFSMQAATSFNSGRTYKDRIWTTCPTALEKRIEDFHRAKLHCSVPRYEYAAGTELAATTGKVAQSMAVNLNQVLHRWKNVNSHELFEAHLPQLIPLDYVDCVYMPQNIFDSLSPTAQQSAKELFKSSLIIYPQSVDMSPLKAGGGDIKLDATRRPYRDFIFDQLTQSIRERMKRPHISRGMVITLSGSNFEAHIVFPMTISQSYDLHRRYNRAASKRPEYTFIYWQAMHGDMMITVAEEKINLEQQQENLRCLVCYIAEKPLTNTQDYYEHYSYLNDGHPAKHNASVLEGELKAKSNVFYRGCNTDDYFTFCLKIDYKTNEATLFHVGPNSIYNHERISYRFDKSDLDLSRIDHVHVSSGNQDVPIRNLTMNHEPMDELDARFDKDFKKDTSGLWNALRSLPDANLTAPRQAAVPKSDQKLDEKSIKPQSVPILRPQSVRPSPKKTSGFKEMMKKLFHVNTNRNKVKAAQPEPQLEPTSCSKDGETVCDNLTTQSPSTRPSRERTPSPAYSSSSRSRSQSPSELTPCHRSIYCLNQNNKEHTNEFSHPCRFNHLCRRQKDELHLTHQRHNIPKCRRDKDCLEKGNPVHRAEYRHTDLSDFLIPCRRQDACHDKSDRHREKYFHGEKIPFIEKKKSTTLILCRHGYDCQLRENPAHAAKYSHPNEPTELF